jgi:ABC-type uncharacterized transport system permease subunit
MSACEGLLWGAFGAVIGVVPDFLRAAKLPVKSRPQWLRSWLFWFSVFIRTVMGAGLVFAYIRSGTLLNPIVAMNIGASLPFFTRSLGRALPGIDTKRTD